MSEELLTFKKFRDPDVAKDLADKLSEAGIFFEIETDDKFFEPSFTGNTIQNETRIKLNPADFIKANKVIDEYYELQISQVASDYYLFDFTDEELEEILEKPDEWGYLDYQLAQSILKERGVEVKVEKLQSLKDKRIYDLSRPEKSSSWLIWIGYFFSVTGAFMGAVKGFMGVFAGIIIGLALFTAKKTLPDGRITHIYIENDRKDGKTMIIIGFVSIILKILFNFFRSTY